MIRCPACGALNRPEAEGCVVCGVALGADLANLGRDTLTTVPNSLRARLESAIAQGQGEPSTDGRHATLFGRAPALPEASDLNQTLYGRAPALSPPGAIEAGGPASDSTPAVGGPPRGDMAATLFGRPAATTVPPPGPPPELSPADPFAQTPDPMRQTLYGRAPMPTAEPEAPADPFEPGPGEGTTPGRPAPTPAAPTPAAPPVSPADLRRTQYGMPAPFAAAPTVEPAGFGPGVGTEPPPRVAAPSSPSVPPVFDPRTTQRGLAPRSTPTPRPAPTTGRHATLYGRPGGFGASDDGPVHLPPPAAQADLRSTRMGLPQPLTPTTTASGRGAAVTDRPTPPQPLAAHRTPVPVPVPPMPAAPAMHAPATPLIQEAHAITEAERARLPGERRAERREAPPEDPSAPAGAPPGTPAEGLARGEVDPQGYAVARLAAAVEAEERVAATRRIRLASILLVLVGLGAAAAAWYIHRQQVAFRAELQGPHAVTHHGGEYTVEVGVRVSGPAVVRHPGGESPVEGATRIKFSLPSERMKVGANELALEVRPADSDKPRTLILKVLVHYRLRTEVIPPPTPGVPITAHVQVMDDWKLTVEGAEAELINKDTYAVRVDPGPLLSRVDELKGDAAELPLPLVLTGPDGQQQTFRETLRVPLPGTPVAIYRPPHNWIGAADSVTVTGASVPGAKVTVNGVAAEVDGRGRFEAVVPLPAPGPHTVKVVADGPSKRPGEQSIALERLTEDGFQAARSGLQARLRKAQPEDRPPPYAALRDDPDAHAGKAIALKGELLHAARGREAGLDTAQIATCKAGSRCVVWVDLRGPLLARPGDVVDVVGVLNGTTRYKTRTGEALVVPRVTAELMVP
ncbi:MAG: hypothetical protein H6702_00325 [Myxococcales bacterium]|nr:hypothetical protein [Myxococcales bacterium]